MRTLVKKTDALQLEMNHLYTLLISFNEYLDSLPQFDPETIDMETNNGLKAINSLLGFHVVLGCLIIELSEIEEKNCKICNNSQWLTKNINPVFNKGDKNE